MSSTVYWLQRQRKTELAALAEHLGLNKYAVFPSASLSPDFLQKTQSITDVARSLLCSSYEHLLKSDLEVLLEEHLRANEETLRNDPALTPFFKRIAQSPIKRESATASSLLKAAAEDEDRRKPRARRQTIKAREELEQG